MQGFARACESLIFKGFLFLGLPSACRTFRMSQAFTVLVSRYPATRRMSSQCSAMRSALTRLREAVQGSVVRLPIIGSGNRGPGANPRFRHGGCLTPRLGAVAAPRPPAALAWVSRRGGRFDHRRRPPRPPRRRRPSRRGRRRRGRRAAARSYEASGSPTPRSPPTCLRPSPTSRSRRP